MYLSNSKTKYFAVMLSFILSIILMLIKLPIWMDYLRPQFILLTLIFWAQDLSPKFIMTSAWILGLFIDVIYNVAFGQHALVLVVIAYIIIQWQVKMKFFSLMQKLIFVYMLAFIYLLPQFYMFLFNNGVNNAWLYCLSPAISGLTLPFWQIIIDKIKRCFVYE